MEYKKILKSSVYYCRPTELHCSKIYRYSYFYYCVHLLVCVAFGRRIMFPTAKLSEL